MNEILANRPTSGFPLSIGTSLAMETLLDPINPVYDSNREIPSRPDLTSYNLYVFNLSTLLRNLISSIPTKDLVNISKKEILDCLLEEVEWISEFLPMNNLNVSFYVNNYKHAKLEYEKKGILRKPKTANQLLYNDIYNYCLSRLVKEDDVVEFSSYVTYSKDTSALILTHVPWDLLRYNSYLKLDLLESNTGVIKTRKQWNTKYYPIADKDMSFLPFMEYILTVLGDHVMFSPSSLKDRLELYENMKRKNVNALTSELSFEFMFKNR